MRLAGDARRRAATAGIYALPLASIVLALALASLLIVAGGHSPGVAFSALLSGAFGGRNSLGNTAITATPLLITALGIIIGIRAGLWNLGGDGQIDVGGLGATVVALHVVSRWPNPVAVPVVVLAGFGAGAVWGGIAGVLRARRGVSEVITTLLLSFVGAALVTYVVEAPLKDQYASFPHSPSIRPYLWNVLHGSQAHAGLILGIALIGVVWLLLWRSSVGLDLRAIGLNPRAANFAGIAVERRIVLALVLSGGVAGIAGAGEVLGVQHELIENLSPGYGFTALAVALLADADPRYVLPSAVFFGALVSGAPVMQQRAGVPLEIALATQGLVILFVVASFGIRNRALRTMRAGRPVASLNATVLYAEAEAVE